MLRWFDIVVPEEKFRLAVTDYVRTYYSISAVLIAPARS